MNVIIYSENGESELKELLEDNENLDVRVFKSSEAQDYKSYNPYVVIFDMDLKKLSEITSVTKFDAGVLVCTKESIENVRIYSEALDVIEKPCDKFLLNTRVMTLAKVMKYKNGIKTLSITDELTGLYNRKYLHHRLDAEIARSKRYGGDVSCILFDIDFFKTVNDMYGYDWGDVLLKKVAQMLQGLIRKEDVLTRYGDEEFILILPNTSESQAFILAERFRHDIEKMEFIPAQEEERHPVTISGGIASYPFLENTDEDSNTIIRYAEHALYAAKTRGKNQVVQFSKMNLEF